MQEFLLIFRNTYDPHEQPSPEQLQERMNWLANIVTQNKLVDKGNSLSAKQAKTVEPGGIVTDGPYTEIKEFISGYMIIRTATIEEAIEIAKANPSLRDGGNIEVRAINKSE